MKKIISFFSLSILLFLSGCQTSSPPPEEDLEVPFTSQAPEENWNEPWQNACEETSIVMVNAFYQGKDALSLEEAKKKILDVYNAKKDKIQVSKDESVETIVEMINTLGLSFQAHVVSNPTQEDLIEEIKNNRPVILPVYAPELDNPFYGEEGPDYHVIVLVGYDETKQMFKVNDPGTKKGEGLEFSYDVLMNAIHDLKPSDYDAGKKRVVFTKGEGV